MQKSNQRAPSSKLLMTQPGEKEPQMPPVPTAACIMNVGILESGERLCSPGLNPPTNADVGGLAQIPPKDTVKSLAVEPEKGSQERANCLPPVSLDKAPADVHHKRKHLPAPEVQEYFFQVNWPQEILQKWAKEKEDKEKIRSVIINQDAAAAAACRNRAFDPAQEGQNVCEKPEDKGSPGIPQK